MPCGIAGEKRSEPIMFILILNCSVHPSVRGKVLMVLMVPSMSRSICPLLKIVVGYRVRVRVRVKVRVVTL